MSEMDMNNTADLTDKEIEALTTRQGKCDCCGKIKPVIEIGLNWACKDSPSCQRIVESRIQAAGMSGYDDLADEEDQRGGKYRTPRKRDRSWD